MAEEAPDFNDLLETPADSIEPPKPLPPGEYRFKVVDYDFGESTVKKTPYVEYGLQPTEAGEDVDEDMLAQVENWQGKRLFRRMYLSQKAMFMLRQFLEDICGMEVEGRTFKELIPEAKGCEVIGTVSVQELDDGRQVNGEVQRLQPVE